MTRDDAVRKVAALLRLAERGGTVGEANAALAKAQEIMDRFQIERTAAELSGQPSEPEEAVSSFYDVPGGELDTMKRLATWRWMLANRVAKANGCYAFTSRRGMGRSIEIVGRPSQVETVRYLYGWLAGEVSRLVDSHGRGLGVVWRREFCEGAAQELGERLKEQRRATVAAYRAEATPQPGALVLVERAIAKIDAEAGSVAAWAKAKHRLVTNSGGGYRQHNGTARQAGRDAARGVSLGGARGGIGSGARRQIGGGS